MLRTRWAAIGAAVAVSVGGGGIGLVHATVDSGERPVLVMLDSPCRLMDSRPGVAGRVAGNTPIGADETYTLDAHGVNGDCDHAPSEATALVHQRHRGQRVAADQPPVLRWRRPRSRPPPT